MVQSALIFTLGFLVATLLGLLLAPVLWRRAQWIMRHRLEAVVPMTLDEVRADRDALRAEHAMAMRRLEVENEEIREIDAEHLLEISRGQEALKARAAAIEARDARIGELDDTVARLSRQIRAREKEIASLEVSHRVASREVVTRRERIGVLTAALTEAEERIENTRQMMAARDTTDAERADELVAARREAGTTRQREAALRAALTDSQTELAEAREQEAMLRASLDIEEARADALARDLEAADGMVRERLTALAASVVQRHGTLDDDPALPVGGIAAAVERLGVDGDAGDEGVREGEPLPDATTMAPDGSSGEDVRAEDGGEPTPDDLMAEMDAAAEVELAPVPAPASPERPKPPSEALPVAANDGAAPDDMLSPPAREGRSPSRP